MIALFSALQEEIGDLRKGMSVNRTSSYPGCVAYEGKCSNRDSLLILTGMGKERAQKATRMVLEKYPVSTLISTGFGGALNDKVEAGDIVVCSKLEGCNGTGTDARPSGALRSDPGLVSASSRTLKDAGVRFVIGNGITISSVCATPEAKSALGRKYLADTVDMESYWIGQIAAGKGIPFIEVRSIFDSVRDDLSWLDHLSSEGKVRSLGALSYLISHPGHTKQVARFARNAMKAERNLSLFLRGLLEEI